MKKVSFGLLALLTSLAVILSACGQKDEGKAGKEIKDKTLHVVTNADYAPFEYLEGDKIVGFDIDFINAVAKEAGYKVNRACRLGSDFC